MENYNSEIIGLIARSTVGQLSEAEKLRLEEWLKNPGHRQFYERVCNRQQIYERSLFYDRHRPEDKWVYLHQRIQKRRYLRIVRYAAMFVLPLVLSCYLYIFHSQQEDVILQSAQSEEILPGCSEVMFYFADGSKLQLAKDTVFRTKSGEILKNEKGALSYERAEEQGQPDVNAYHRVKTMRGGEYKMILPDGSRVWLNSESSLRFPVAFATDCRKVYAEGELYFEVARDVTRPFIVVSGGTEVEVLGTEFNIRNYSGIPYAATLVKGSVALRCNGERVKLKPGQQALLNPETMRLAVSEVDVMPFIAWKNGYFYFENKCLEEIMEELARWYDLTVFYENETIRQERFTVELRRHDNFRDIVHLLEQTGSVRFGINKRTVVVR